MMSLGHNTSYIGFDLSWLKKKPNEKAQYDHLKIHNQLPSENGLEVYFKP